MTVNERIIAIIHESGLSAKGFAEKIGILQQTLYNYIQKDREPNYTVLLKTLQSFPEISAEWLITGKGEMLKSETPVSDTPTPTEISIETATPEQLKIMLYALQKKVIDLQDKIIELQTYDDTGLGEESYKMLEKQIEALTARVRRGRQPRTKTA